MPSDRHPATLTDLAGLIDDLDGFPIRPMILDYLTAPAGDSPARVRMATTVDHALTQWLSIVGRDLESLPPRTTRVLEDISRSMLSTRAALVEVRDQFRRLSQADLAPVQQASAQPLAQIV